MPDDPTAASLARAFAEPPNLFGGNWNLVQLVVWAALRQENWLELLSKRSSDGLRPSLALATMMLMEKEPDDLAVQVEAPSRPGPMRGAATAELIMRALAEVIGVLAKGDLKAFGIDTRTEQSQEIPALQWHHLELRDGPLRAVSTAQHHPREWLEISVSAADAVRIWPRHRSASPTAIPPVLPDPSATLGYYRLQPSSVEPVIFSPIASLTEGDPDPAISSMPTAQRRPLIGPAVLHDWYAARVETANANSMSYSSEADFEAAVAAFDTRVTREMVRAIRNDLAPAHWRRRGRPKKPT